MENTIAKMPLNRQHDEYEATKKKINNGTIAVKVAVKAPPNESHVQIVSLRSVFRMHIVSHCSNK